MPDILSIGEMLVDFTIHSDGGDDVLYKQNAGGAPANVAVMAAKLGVSSGFMGKIGNDVFGKFLFKTLEENNVDTSGVVFSQCHPTALAFIKDNGGERNFIFYRNKTADTRFKLEEVDFRLIDNCKLFHFGSLSLTSDPSRTAVTEAVGYAKKSGKIVTYDPNWRESLWSSIEDGVLIMNSILWAVDIIKVSESELQVITDIGNMLPAIAKLLNSGVKIVCITQGAKGCIIATRTGIERVPTFKVQIMDTLGAGDSFFGAFITKIVKSEKPIEDINMGELKAYAIYANACGALSSTKMGAISAMPTDGEIVNCMQHTPVEL